MKKILSLIAAGAMALGLIGCSGDLHDAVQADSTILGEAGIIGTINGWTVAKMTKVDDTTYTYIFTAADTSAQFSVQEVSGNWATRWCGNNTADVPTDPETTAIAPGGELKAMVYSSEANPTHVQISGLLTASKYKITVVITDAAAKAVSCKVELHEQIENNAGPLDGYQFKSSINSYGDGPELVREGETNTYKVEFTTGAETEIGFKIATADWTVSYPLDAEGGSCLSVDISGDATFDAYKGDSGMSNPTMSGLKASTTYVATIVASDDGKYVTVTIVEK
ncbi:MAG: hypothetical protein UHP28_08160 [Treponema sp.]|nr:hypothetical protein [Treponema sp.]